MQKLSLMENLKIRRYEILSFQKIGRRNIWETCFVESSNHKIGSSHQTLIVTSLKQPAQKVIRTFNIQGVQSILFQSLLYSNWLMSQGCVIMFTCYAHLNLWTFSPSSILALYPICDFFQLCSYKAQVFEHFCISNHLKVKFFLL